MQIALALILTALGLWLFRQLFRLADAVQRGLAAVAEQELELPLRVARFTPDEPIQADGLLFLYAHEFVQSAPRRPLGSVPRDRAYACLTQEELDPDDFARQLLYVVLTELIAGGYLAWRIVPREPTFMPPYPHKRWELQFRQEKPFPASPLNESLDMAFDLGRKQRLARRRKAKAPSETDAPLEENESYFSLEELLERMLKVIRQEMTFWERGTCCSDLRRHVENALLAQGYLQQPPRETWLDSVRRARPLPNKRLIESLAPQARALRRRLEAFRQRYGSPLASHPKRDERGRLVDIDPQLATHSGPFDDLPLDDCLRLTIHEAIASIKQLEPSGEAGI